jgi:hypothetical protein
MGTCGQLQNNRLHNFQPVPDTLIIAVKWRRVRWAGYVTCMGEMRNTKFLLENLNRTDTWQTQAQAK